MIPRERWDPVAAKIVALIPDPNVPGSTIYASTPVTETRQDQFDVRVDHQFAPSMSFFATLQLRRHRYIPALARCRASPKDRSTMRSDRT